MALRTVRLLLVLTGLGLVAGCHDAGEDGAAASGPAVEGVPWVVASGLDVPGWESVAPSATFADGRVSGFGGCNRFNGSYELDGEHLQLGDIASTRMACAPPGSAVEEAYFEALSAVAGWRADGDELVLLDADGAEVLRLREPSLAGAWTATAFLQHDAVSSPIAGTEVTATFGADGVLSGSAGCNPYRATFTSDRGEIRITEITIGAKACTAPAGVMEQEQAYVDALPLARSYQLDGPSLTLLTEEGTIVATYILS